MHRLASISKYNVFIFDYTQDHFMFMLQKESDSLFLYLFHFLSSNTIAVWHTNIYWKWGGNLKSFGLIGSWLTLWLTRMTSVLTQVDMSENAKSRKWKLLWFDQAHLTHLTGRSLRQTRSHTDPIHHRRNHFNHIGLLAQTVSMFKTKCNTIIQT